MAQLEFGLVAVTNPVFAVVSGGIGCLVVVALVAWRVPALRWYCTCDPSAIQREVPGA